MRPIRIEEHEMKKITLTKEQLKQAIRNYIRPAAIPPRDTPIHFECGPFKSMDLNQIESVTLEWSQASFIKND